MTSMNERFDSSLCDNHSLLIKLLILASSVRENSKDVN